MGSVLSAYQLFGSNKTDKTCSSENKDSIKKNSSELSPSKEKVSERAHSEKTTKKTIYEEPTFSTNLTEPIENVINETIASTKVLESQESVKKKVKAGKKKRDKSKKQLEIVDVKNTEKDVNVLPVETNVYIKSEEVESFHLPAYDKNKKVDTNQSQSHEKVFVQNTKLDSTQDKVTRTFKASKRLKGTSSASTYITTKKSYKHQAVIEPLPVVNRRFSNSFEKVQNFVSVNTLEEKLGSDSESVLKESRKVSPTISFANIVSNIYEHSDRSEKESDCFENLNEKIIPDTNFEAVLTSLKLESCVDSPQINCLNDIESFIKVEKPSKKLTVDHLVNYQSSFSESFDSQEDFEELNPYELTSVKTNSNNDLSSDLSIEASLNSCTLIESEIKEIVTDTFLDTSSNIKSECLNSVSSLSGNTFESFRNSYVNEIDNSTELSRNYNTTESSNLYEDLGTDEEPIIPLDNKLSVNNSSSKVFNSNQIHQNCTDSEQNSVILYMEKMDQTRVLSLNDKEHQECTLYRLQKNWVLQFRVGPSLFGRKVFLYCNYPLDDNSFVRSKYYLIPWQCDEGCKNADDTAAFANIRVKNAGSFHYYFTFSKGSTTREGSGYFLVDPMIKYGKDEDLPLDCIQCQTVLAKGLGSFSSWENKLKVAKESGYNMIHFTPIQELGDSNSSYSLREQLQLNPLFRKKDSVMPTFDEIEHFIANTRTEWKMASVCDIVLNHTANESTWIQKHPEVTYNCLTCPYMRPAYLLDAALHQFSIDVKKGHYEDKGIPKEVNTEDHLNAIRYHFRHSVLEPLNIPQLFLCDVNKYIMEFITLARTSIPNTATPNAQKKQLTLEQDPEFKRLSAIVDLSLALETYNVFRSDTFDEDTRLKKCAEDFKEKLEALNKIITEEVNKDLDAAIENVIAGIRYYRVQADGPKFKDISIKTPLVYRYFTDYGTPSSLKEHEEIMYSENGRFLMAHNGWVMESDPLRNFADADSKVYLRRELIAWGDSVKLRYGDKPEDCPFLWDHMRKYVEQTVRIFDGVRLDNCHSTPIPVAEYLLDCARKIRPDLYVVAELFTNSDMTDNIFVNRLGITSLIREAMSAWDSHEEGRLVYRYGGYPVGSFYQPSIRPLVPSIAHALFLDLTHDNPSPVEKRSVFDLLPSTALVNMACCASGSNRGYDELVPHHIHVVDETREYTEWSDDDKLATDDVKYVSKRSGLINAKKALNDLHFALGKNGYNQVYVDQMDPDIVAVTRHCPNTHQSYILVAFTAFGHPGDDAAKYQKGIKPLRFEGVLDEIVLEATLSHFDEGAGGSKFKKFEKFVKDSKYINGLSEYKLSMKQHIQVEDSDIFELSDSGSSNITQLNFKNFKPGSIVVVKTSLPVEMKKAVESVRNLINEFSLSKNTELHQIVSKMSLADLNRALYRCDKEERDEGYGFDTYNIPNFGFMVYAGLQGMISLLANIRPNNDLGHPLCANIRDGNWMIDYIWRRLKFDEGTKSLGEWIEQKSDGLKSIPRYLIPCYFDVIVTGIYLQLVEHCYELMSSFVKNGSSFVRGLSLGSVQMGAYIKTAELPTLSPNLSPPKPPTRKNETGEEFQTCVTLSAGLPHFSTGYMRNWGRDTFIALRGLFILTGRYQEAREQILAYGGCLRHGLIPNLLDGGRNPRYNCRDAVWWWLYCIKEYVEESPNGLDILLDKVSRIFPNDDSTNQPPGAVDQPLYDVMQEALEVHFQGLVFTERNAGKQIDEHMTSQGFNNQIGIHPETGFVFGGNQWNCGTWMDKMGSSEKAGNRGKPATPRDGSAVELIGLSKAVVSWLDRLHSQKKYPYSGVQRKHKNGSITKWSFKEWSDKIQANFEKHFWVNTKPVDGEIRQDLINKRGIYKDTYGSIDGFPDFQLRCNFPIAMVVAPELFTPERAWQALQQAEKYLLGPLGMKTLDPEDWAYRGDYDNSNDSNDLTVANGFNYHQGPEWVWPIGFFLRAKLLFAHKNGAVNETLANTKLILSKHFVELQTSVWRGLPELTNSNGAYCKDSSRTQAWSMSCVLEVLHELLKMESSLVN